MSRTLVITNDFPPRVGGIQSFVRDLCAQLPPDEVVVHASYADGAEEYDARQPFPVVRDPNRVLLPTRAAGERVVSTMVRHGCDRVLFGASAPLGLLAPRLRAAGAREVVALTHGHEVWWAALPGTRRLLRRIGDSVDELTYVSEYCRERIAPALSDGAARRMRRLSPTVDTERFRPGSGGDAVRARWGIAPRAPVVVCLSRFVRRKGQDTLVRIWPEVLARFPDAVLLLVGDGPDRGRVERMADRRGLGGSVVFTGEVPDEQVAAHLQAGDVFAMPSRSRWFGLEVEAFGIVYLEAAACGLRVVAGRSGGISEAIGDAVRLRTTGSGAAGVRGQRAVERGAGVGEELGDDATEGPQDDDEERGDRGREQAVLRRARAGLAAVADQPVDEDLDHVVRPVCAVAGAPETTSGRAGAKDPRPTR